MHHTHNGLSKQYALRNTNFIPFDADVGRYKIVITENWILKCGMHSVQAIRQSEAQLK